MLITNVLHKDALNRDHQDEKETFLMEKKKLLDCVAPCSLLCYACPSFIDGLFQNVQEDYTIIGMDSANSRANIYRRRMRMAFRI